VSRVVATVACRAESTRLYGKPLQMVGDRPILAHLLDRLRLIPVLDEIGLAISDTPSKQVFIEFAERHHLPYVVGPEDDVLGRLIACAELMNGELLVRVTSENPFVYWENVAELVERHRQRRAAISVTIDLPVGAALEVVSLSAHRAAHSLGDSRHRQAPSEFFTEHEDRFVVQRISAPPPVNAPELRMTVDAPEDLMLARAVWGALHRESHCISVAEIVALLRARPDLTAMNAALRSPYLWHGEKSRLSS
jgi:spore coat polysaccharide biosynthesis protein SpsF